MLQGDLAPALESQGAHVLRQPISAYLCKRLHLRKQRKFYSDRCCRWEGGCKAIRIMISHSIFNACTYRHGLPKRPEHATVHVINRKSMIIDHGMVIGYDARQREVHTRVHQHRHGDSHSMITQMMIAHECLCVMSGNRHRKCSSFIYINIQSVGIQHVLIRQTA